MLSPGGGDGAPQTSSGKAAAGQTRYGKISTLQEEARHLSSEKRTLQRQLREKDGRLDDMEAQLRAMNEQLAQVNEARGASPKVSSKEKKKNQKQQKGQRSDADSFSTWSSDEDYDEITGAAFASEDSAAQAEALRQLAAAATKNKTLYNAEKNKLGRLKERLADSLDEVEDLNDELEEMEAGEITESQ